MGRSAAFGYDGPPGLHETVRRALRWVVDPELGSNIVDAGLVGGVKVDDQEVCVRLTLRSRDCPVGDVIREDVEAELFDHLQGSRRIRVELVWDPPWSAAGTRVVPLRRKAA